jgi:hypothetical protein
MLAGLAAAEPPLTIPFEFYGNAIWLSGSIHGRGPFHMLLDTAAGRSVLNASRIPDVGLTALKEWDQPNAGSGDRPTHISLLPEVAMEFSGVKLDWPGFVAVPLDEVSRTYGTAIDAIIGCELMSKYVVKIDFDERKLTLFDPATFSYKGAGAVLPLEVRSCVPVVRAKIGMPDQEPIEGEFLIDEPHPGAVMFTTPFIRRNNLLEAARKVNPRLVHGSAMGVGGKIDLVDGRVGSLHLGPYEMKMATAGYPEAKAGAFARTDIAGILGGEVWRRFRVWLDYAHGKLILEPDAQFRDPFESDASGLRVRSAGPPFREIVVSEVNEDSPASDAGIQKGDQILELAGNPAAQLTVWQIRTMMKKAGNKYALKLRRGEREFTVQLATRALN